MKKFSSKNTAVVVDTIRKSDVLNWEKLKIDAQVFKTAKKSM